ncbi:MAG: helix-turn-helix transcriptional regulator [Candidatus Dormibacteria bacterium]
MDGAQDRSLEQVVTLADPVRRRVYAAVAARFPQPVDRDDVAAAAKISRRLAAFHLDRLAAANLVDTSFARRTGRVGRGAGRPAKFYRRAVDTISVSFPRRRFDVAAQVMARALSTPAAHRRVIQEAHAEGHRLAHAARSRRRGGERLMEILASQGFEPEFSDGRIRLRTCPFDATAALSGEANPVVCTMNRALIEGVVDGLGEPSAVVRDRRPEQCCVAVEPAASG